MTATILEQLTTLLDAIDSNLRIAITLSEVNYPPSFDKATISKLDHTLAANVLSFVRAQLASSMIAALMRIWDKGEETHSVPNLAKLLQEQETVEFLVRERRNARLALASEPLLVDDAKDEPALADWLSSTAENDAAEAEREIRKIVQDVICEVAHFLQSPLFESLKTARDKLAHALEQTWEEKRAIRRGRKIEALRRGEIEDVIRLTDDVVTKLEGAIRGNHPNFRQHRRLWSALSADFWDRINPLPKGRPKRPRHPTR